MNIAKCDPKKSKRNDRLSLFALEASVDKRAWADKQK